MPTSETIALHHNQTHVLHQNEFAFAPDITFTGPASASVLADGNFELAGPDRLGLPGPTLRGHGLLDLSNGGTAQLGAVGPGETIKLAFDSWLELDKPMQFLGTIDADSVPLSIYLPTATGFDHATFDDHVLRLFNAQDHILAQLKIAGVDHLFVLGGAGTTDNPSYHHGTSINGAISGDVTSLFTEVREQA